MSGTNLGYLHGLFPRSRRLGADILWPNNIIGLNESKPKNNDNLLTFLVFLLTLTVFLALFAFRALDDNRLTSWHWAFADVDVLNILFALVIGASLAHALSNISLPVRKPAIWLFISSFAAAGILWGEPEVIVDASRYFIQAKHLELYGVGYFLREWGNDIAVWTDLPLVPFLYGLIFSVFGETRMVIQLFSTLLFSGTVVLTYLIGKTLWNETVGIYGGALLLGMPYLLTQVPLMLVDVPTMFFLTLAVFTTIKAVKQGGTGLMISASAVIVLAMLSKYSAWLMLSVVSIIFLSHLEYGWRVILRRAAVISLGAVLLMGLVILWKFDVMAEQFSLLQSYQIPGLGRWGESFTSTFLFQIHPFITIAALYSIYLAIKKRDLYYAIIGWMLFLVMLLEIRRTRYIILVFPMLALMASYGLTQIKNAKLGRYIVSCTVVSTLIIAVFGYLPFLQKTSTTNIKNAGKYLNSIRAANVEVFVLPQTRSIINPAISVALLDLFTEKKITYHDNSDIKPRPELIEKSPLRFTWEYENPEFFTSGSSHADEITAVAIIFSDGNQTIPGRIARRISGYRLSREFTRLDKVFRYQTLIRVYEPA
ncbi:MAG: glycosyltransferase family 39 protein [Acidiferrobacterales bacterium]